MAVYAAGDELRDAAEGLVCWAQHVQLQLVERQQLAQLWQLGQGVEVCCADGEGQGQLVEMLQARHLQRIPRDRAGH